MASAQEPAAEDAAGLDTGPRGLQLGEDQREKFGVGVQHVDRAAGRRGWGRRAPSGQVEDRDRESVVAGSGHQIRAAGICGVRLRRGLRGRGLRLGCGGGLSVRVRRDLGGVGDLESGQRPVA